MEKYYYIYLITNPRFTVLYTGVTNDLIRRVYEHKNKSVTGFTEQYNVNPLVYYEIYGEIVEAIAREKQIKGWSRKKKEALIKEMNPRWEDLYETLF